MSLRVPFETSPQMVVVPTAWGWRLVAKGVQVERPQFSGWRELKGWFLGQTKEQFGSQFVGIRRKDMRTAQPGGLLFPAWSLSPQAPSPSRWSPGPRARRREMSRLVAPTWIFQALLWRFAARHVNKAELGIRPPDLTFRERERERESNALSTA